MPVPEICSRLYPSPRKMSSSCIPLYSTGGRNIEAVVNAVAEVA